MAVAPPWQTQSPRELGERDLKLERDRLEKMLREGTLSTMDGRRLAHVRRCLKRIEELKFGADNFGIG